MNKKEELEKLYKEWVHCEACESCLKSYFVRGYGNPDSDIMIIGEAPSNKGNEKKIPFSGRGGTLFFSILDKSFIKKEDFFITNILHCFPGEHRKPKKSEILNCQEPLILEIAIIQPKIILCLGRTARENLVGNYYGAAVYFMKHPAYYLRSGKIMILRNEIFKFIKFYGDLLKNEKQLNLL